ncbi:hypothetical protein AURDEDRAFT_173614 [Auricularia subglabra TFB-10046 SS5]|uniref:GED domain-containing protein n=1 Tax=Auricularia subglabra (strain TFB-10046 / SS5) TaxID=717982 RepID=J0WVS4_AURST|nr:hypothetical protein AURDEDRAFT_173614 [Auricularia subglabra TFB-10046 SS5]
MSSWAQPTHAFVQAVSRRVESELHERVRRHFGAYAHGGLDTHIYSLVLSQVREHRRRLTAQLDELLESARVPVAIGGAYEHFFTIFRAHFRDASLAAQGHGATVSILRNGGGAAAEALEVLRTLGFPGDLTEADLLRLFPPKSREAERALDAMASVRAYYHVATQCFLDTAVQTTVAAFLNPLGRDLGAALVDGMDVGDQERATHWLSRAPGAQERKAELEHRRVRLQRGVDLLARLSFAR